MASINYSNRHPGPRVLMIGDRYFAYFSPRGRCITAWSIHGARVFAGWDQEAMENAETALTIRGKRYARVGVAITRI